MFPHPGAQYWHSISKWQHNSTALGHVLSPQCSAAPSQAPLISFGDLAQGHWDRVLAKGLSPDAGRWNSPCEHQSLLWSLMYRSWWFTKITALHTMFQLNPVLGTMILLRCRGWGKKAARERTLPWKVCGRGEGGNWGNLGSISNLLCKDYPK